MVMLVLVLLLRLMVLILQVVVYQLEVLITITFKFIPVIIRKYVVFYQVVIAIDGLLVKELGHLFLTSVWVMTTKLMLSLVCILMGLLVLVLPIPLLY